MTERLTIPGRDGRSRRVALVGRVGVWALHRTPQSGPVRVAPDLAGWSVTHVPSRMAVVSRAGEQRARAVLEALGAALPELASSVAPGEEPSRTDLSRIEAALARVA